MPNPDGFVSGGERLPKGYAVATAHAEAVLLDRVRAQLENHYDQVFTDEWLQKEHARQMSGGGSAEDDGPRAPPPIWQPPPWATDRPCSACDVFWTWHLSG